MTRTDVIYCDNGQRSGCTRQARWWITTASPSELPMCDLCAEFYLRKPDNVYPRRAIPYRAPATPAAEQRCGTCGHERRFHPATGCDCEGDGEAGLCPCPGYAPASSRPATEAEFLCLECGATVGPDHIVCEPVR